MLAFYGWTNLILLNHINVKKTFYAAHQADLFVLKLPRVSDVLIDLIRDSGVFNAVYILHPFYWFEGKSIWRKIISLFHGNKVFLHYNKQLDQLAKGKQYDHFFTGALWSESLHILHYFALKNKSIKISYTEEGTVSYCEPAGLVRCMPRKGIREIALRCFHHWPWFRLAKKNVCSLYLYQPALVNSATSIKIKALPQVTACCALGGILDKLSAYQTLSRGGLGYKEADCIFFIPQVEINTSQTKKTEAILKNIVKALPSQRVLMRPHPADGLASIRSFADSSKSFQVDYSALPIEALFFQLPWDKKIIVSSRSSALIQPLLMFGKMPWVIMTHKLYDTPATYGVDGSTLDALVTRLYRGSGKLYIPDTQKALEDTILEISRQNQF